MELFKKSQKIIYFKNRIKMTCAVHDVHLKCRKKYYKRVQNGSENATDSRQYISSILGT